MLTNILCNVSFKKDLFKLIFGGVVMGSVSYSQRGSNSRLILHSFKPFSSDLDAEHCQWLTDLAELMAKTPGAYIDFYGACSGSGDMSVNEKTANDRMNKAFSFLKSKYPAARYNLWWVVKPQDYEKNEIYTAIGPSASARAIYLEVVGAQLSVLTKLPQLRPMVWFERETAPKFRHYVAPPGAWLIMAVDNFGTPVIKFGLGPSAVVLKLLNDKGELFYIKGIGVSAGIGLEVEGDSLFKASAKFSDKAVGWAKDVFLKSGDVPNISKTIRDLDIVGPNQTTGGIFVGGKFSSGVTFSEIIQNGFFALANIDGQSIVAGAEVGIVLFGAIGNSTFGAEVAGFYTSLGLGTFKLGGEAGASFYTITESGKLKDRVEGWSDI